MCYHRVKCLGIAEGRIAMRASACRHTFGVDNQSVHRAGSHLALKHMVELLHRTLDVKSQRQGQFFREKLMKDDAVRQRFNAQCRCTEC